MNLKTRTFKVAEIFGPVAQGEGVFAGAPCYFVRFGGCDYRCTWCDSMHAVLPELVHELPDMTAAEIGARVRELPGEYRIVVLSGGNPAIWRSMDRVIEELQRAGRDRIHVETQGTVWQQWFTLCEHVTLSPKPPSSLMSTDLVQLNKIIYNLRATGVDHSLKVVVFNDEDLQWALSLARMTPKTKHPFFISCGTDAKDTTQDLADRYAWLIENVLVKHGTEYPEIRVLPQLHVIAFGHRLGV